MKTSPSALSKAQQQLHHFMQEAPKQILDLLAVDGETAWQTIFPDHPVLFGLRAVWRRMQAEQAALRALQAAAPVAIPLQTEMERRHLARQLLSDEHVLSDTVLIRWICSRTPSELRLLKEQVEELYPRINLPGYRAIAAEAARLGWPELFREDLVIDLKWLCALNAPKRFWWGIRSTGTDLYRPNEVWDLEWALARRKYGPDEQRSYRYNGEALHQITLDALILQLAHTLDIPSYERARESALVALTQAKPTRFRDWETAKTYEEARQAFAQADEALRKGRLFKQQYC